MHSVHKLLETIPVYQKGILGHGIGIAIVDTGIAPHQDFSMPSNRIIAFYDSARPKHKSPPYDDSGHGTHVAGIAAGCSPGLSAGFLAGKSPPTTIPGNEFCGIAPACHLIGIRILNQYGNGHMEDMLPALTWILEHRTIYDIRIVNISIGCSSLSCREEGEDSPLVRAVGELWDAGLIVVAAAGNDGPDPMSITAPGNSRKIITVGSAEEDLQGKFSGRGPTTSCILKPDIVAPGRKIVSCATLGRNGRNGHVPRGYTMKSGTSMSTPMVSGAIALLLSRYPKLSNLEVKIRLKNSAISLGLPHERQGWGLLNVKRLVLH